MHTEALQEKEINGYPHVRYMRETFEMPELAQRSKQFHEWLDTRRTVRDFSDRPVPQEVIENLIMAASTAPSGAHKQPWTFCAVSDASIKQQIQEAAEEEERESYAHRMSDRWLKDLQPIGTDWHKPFLTIAPWLVVLFKRVYERDDEGQKANNYYVNESVGLAAGMFISAVHHAGLVTLTHTPSPMNFLQKILGRPENERPFLLLPVGYPAQEVYVPKFSRKALDEVCVFY